MNLIYDRTAADVERALALAKKAEAGTLTDAEKTEWLAGMKGCYNATDMNRVSSAVQTLAAELNAAGYVVAVEPVLKGDSRLPSGYTQLEYIESSGTQCINTGFKPNQNARLVMDATLLSTTSAYLYGCRGGASENYNNRFGILYNGSYMRSDFGTGNGLTFSAAITANERYVFDQNKNVCKIGAETVTNSEEVFTSLYPILMFGVNEGGVNSYLCSMRLYSCRIYDNGTLVRNLIPAKDSSGTIGLYDTVNSALYGNSGTGTFAAGAEVGKAEDREWRESDTVRLTQWRQYLANVQALRDAYYTLAETGELPGAEDRLDYIGANNIEKILADIDLLIGWMKSSYRRCGTFTAGQTILPRKG